MKTQAFALFSSSFATTKDWKIKHFPYPAGSTARTWWFKSKLFTPVPCCSFSWNWTLAMAWNFLTTSEIQASNRRVQSPGHRSQVASHRSQVTGHRSQVTVRKPHSHRDVNLWQKIKNLDPILKRICIQNDTPFYKFSIIKQVISHDNSTIVYLVQHRCFNVFNVLMF